MDNLIPQIKLVLISPQSLVPSGLGADFSWTLNVPQEFPLRLSVTPSPPGGPFSETLI